ncbi:helix-turn-helix domain-containing protein [Streptomyces triculaminicus]|uniref:Helix-turn-helix domain-containing protein n=2 Tax=Streptomyces TaxID=1883 RepID=A0A939JQZ4_9ACTN|nr:helix-turn-helix transcriptional regulator [Streptomyces triculaminicus]MBO0653790.1 helix-turn-helix domain-containing protein [Streptomyces triculaminicus]QSY48576.1 helix-turn-helix domain-containing protein [Streptomyces griseocarneus]
MSAVPKSGESAAGSVIALKRDPKQAGAARLLGDQLRRLRQERGLGLKDVAPVIRGSVSKVSRLERGESPPKDRDIHDLLQYYGVSPELAREIEGLVQQTRNEEWWQQYLDVTPGFLKRLISLEGTAARIRTYETHVVPGLLQTQAYARVLVAAAMPDATEEEIKRRVGLRVGRQRILDESRPSIVALLDEAVLHRRVGGPEVMEQQLAHLQELAARDRVNIRVVPFDSGVDVTPAYPITHLHFDDGGPAELVYVEHIDSAQYLTRPKEIDQYRYVLDRLMGAAAHRDASNELLSSAIERCRGRRP